MNEQQNMTLDQTKKTIDLQINLRGLLIRNEVLKGSKEAARNLEQIQQRCLTEGL
jgi:hypothetical protein